LAAEAHYFLLDQKVTKNQVIRWLADSLRSWPLPRKSGKTWAAKSCPTSVRSWPSLRKFRYALQPHSPTLFCLISPEAALLTGNIKSPILLNKILKKAGKGLTEKRAREYGGNDGLAFALRAGAKKALRTGRAG
jgi:hypothetical protein